MPEKVDLADRLKFLYGPPSASHDAEALLLSCMDFRFFGLVAAHMMHNGLVGKYDHVVVAGASLGPLVDFPPEPRLHWQQFFLDHLSLSSKLHKISRIVVLDHRDCGAYKTFGLLPESPTIEEEYNCHKAQALRLQCLIRKFRPEIHFEAYLLDLPCGEEPLLKGFWQGDRTQGLEAIELL